jgi:UDP-N-acetylmuramyl-tripeptide synthetase
LFVGRSGGSVDGRSYIAAAAQAGAAAVLTDAPGAASAPGVPGVCVLTASDPARAGAELGERLWGGPSRGLGVVAVTGTNGKTTVATLVHSVLRHAGVRAGLIGTVSVDDGRAVRRASMTTPPAIEVSRLLATMRDNGCRACAMEASSHALHQGRVAAIRVGVGVFTNLTQDHLDYHGTMEAYAAAKRVLFESLPEDGVGVYNADDSHGAWMAAPARQRIACRAGDRARAEDGPGAWCVAARSAGLDGMDVVVRGPELALAGRVPLVGEHNAMNLVQALVSADRVLAGLGWEAGARRDALEAALPACVPPRGRLERVGHGSGPAVFVDYAHTDDALTRTLAQVRRVMPERARLWVVFGCGGDRDRGKRPKMGRAAVDGADEVIVTSDNPRRELPGAIIAEVLAGLTPGQRGRARVHEDREHAIRAAVLGAGDGDVVVIAGKGHETEQVVSDGAGGTRAIEFDDARAAREVLAERGAARRHAGAAS